MFISDYNYFYMECNRHLPMCHGFHKVGSVIAEELPAQSEAKGSLRRSNLLDGEEIASGWKQHPALTMTQHGLICQATL
jgi:hypothetical protein